MSPLLLHVCRGADREGVLCVLSSAFRNMNSMAKIAPNFHVKLPNSVFRAGVFKEIHTVTMLAFGFSHAGGSPADMDTEVGQLPEYFIPELLYRNVLPGLVQPIGTNPHTWLYFPPLYQGGNITTATYLLTQRFVTLRQKEKLIPNMGNTMECQE